MFTKMISTVLIVIMILSWVVFTTSVLLMSPKWWLGMGIGWVSGSWDYGSQKSVEWKLKYLAIVTSIIFVATAIALPYSLRG